MKAAINQLGNQQPFESSLTDETELENPHLRRPFNEVGSKFADARSLYKRGSGAVVTPQVTTLGSVASERPAADDATRVTATSNAPLRRPLDESMTDGLLGRGRDVAVNRGPGAPADAMVLMPGLPGGTQITDLPHAIGLGRDAAPPAARSPRGTAQPPPAQTPRTAFASLAGRVSPARAVRKETGQGPAR
jgi:hypothetical protein